MHPQCIIIKKYSQAEDNIKYFVQDMINEKEFFVVISPIDQEITYFSKKDEFIKKIILNSADQQFAIAINNIDPHTIYRINFILYKALKNNFFPDDLSYISGG